MVRGQGKSSISGKKRVVNLAPPKLRRANQKTSYSRLGTRSKRRRREANNIGPT